jgi:hypothetical protein
MKDCNHTTDKAEGLTVEDLGYKPQDCKEPEQNNQPLYSFYKLSFSIREYGLLQGVEINQPALEQVLEKFVEFCNHEDLGDEELDSIEERKAFLLERATVKYHQIFPLQQKRWWDTPSD